MAAYLLMALTNALAGREQEYNRWFDDVHIPEILKVDGFRSVQRFELSGEQRVPGPYPFRYTALYRFESDDLASTLAALGAAVQRGPKTDASDAARRALWVFTPLGPERFQPD